MPLNTHINCQLVTRMAPYTPFRQLFRICLPTSNLYETICFNSQNSICIRHVAKHPASAIASHHALFTSARDSGFTVETHEAASFYLLQFARSHGDPVLFAGAYFVLCVNLFTEYHTQLPDATTYSDILTCSQLPTVTSATINTYLQAN